MKHLAIVQSLIQKGYSGERIAAYLKARGYRVFCFGSYWTVGKKLSDRVCWFTTTDNKVGFNYVHQKEPI